MPIRLDVESFVVLILARFNQCLHLNDSFEYFQKVGN